MPIIEAITRHPKNIILAMGARFAENGLFYVFTTFALTFVSTQLKLDRVIALNGAPAGLDHQHRRGSGMGRALGQARPPPDLHLGRRGLRPAGIPVLLALLETRPSASSGWPSRCPSSSGHAAMYGPQASFLSELFSARVSYSGASLGYQLASVFAGGLSPLIATGLLAWGGGRPWAVALYMIGLVVITVVSVLSPPRPSRAASAPRSPR